MRFCPSVRRPPQELAETAPLWLQRDRAPTDAQPLGADDCLQVADRLVQSVALVDDHIVVFADPLHLAFGRCESDTTFLGSLSTSRREPRHELLERRRS